MITVAIVSFRYGHLVAQAIESVLSQTRPPEDVVVVDDGVGDVEEVADKYPVRTVIREQNLGIVDNFNDILFNHVETQRVMFLGADNYLRPDCLELVGREDADIVSYDIAIFGALATEFAAQLGVTEKVGGFPIWRFNGGDIDQANYIHGSSLYNAELARQFGYRPSGGVRTEEDWMLFRAMLRAGASHKHVRQPLLYYRRHKANFHDYTPSLSPPPKSSGRAYLGSLRRLFSRQ